MRSLFTITALLAGANLSHTSPVMSNAIVQPPAKYNLQTKVVDNKQSSNSNKDGLYLVSYHTGAGLGAGGLSTTAPEQWYAYLENGHQYFSYNGSNAAWPLQIGYGAYQAWVPLSISESGPFDPNQKFFFDSNGLQYNGPNNGWLGQYNAQTT